MALAVAAPAAAASEVAVALTVTTQMFSAYRTAGLFVVVATPSSAPAVVTVMFSGGDRAVRVNGATWNGAWVRASGDVFQIALPAGGSSAGNQLQGLVQLIDRAGPVTDFTATVTADAPGLIRATQVTSGQL